METIKIKTTIKGGDLEVKNEEVFSLLEKKAYYHYTVNGSSKILGSSQYVRLSQRISGQWMLFLSSKGCNDEYPIIEGTIVDLEILNEVSNVWAEEKGQAVMKSVYKGSLYTIDGEYFKPIDMEDIICLENGKFLVKDYGKCRPNLTFITDKPQVLNLWEAVKPTDLNLGEGDLRVMKGTFFTSKKGTACFDTTSKNPKHILVCDAWGGAFNSYRGRTLPEGVALYYRRAATNGRGAGYDFAIYPTGWKNVVSEEEI